MNVSIFIQTLNEQENLPELLDTVEWSDDIVILDSLSTDNTKAVALSRGCRWYERKFDGRGPHQNWAMANIQFKHPWVFYLDADERMTRELREEILGVATDPAEKRVAFYCGRKNYFLGKWIRHAFPPWNILRFFRPEYVSFARACNPTAEIRGSHGFLKNMFLHYNFSKGFHEWLERHNRYSTFEAKETVRALSDNPLRWRKLFNRDASIRRRELKNLSLRLPARPLFKFSYLYFVKRGFMDGYAGFTYCCLQLIYEYMIVLKVTELRLRATGKGL